MLDVASEWRLLSRQSSAIISLWIGLTSFAGVLQDSRPQTFQVMTERYCGP
jgi:hypothetical protein